MPRFNNNTCELATMTRFSTSWISIVICMMLVTSSYSMSYGGRKECLGDILSLSKSGTEAQRYELLREMYTNCTHVLQNLVISHFENRSLDFSFLKDIREVFGSVLIVSNFVNTIPLRSLIIIRGETLYTTTVLADAGRKFSLYVAMNSRNIWSNLAEVDGLRELQMNSLQEIVEGEVMFKGNRLLCFVETIKWDYIVSTVPKFDEVEHANYTKSTICKAKVCSEGCSRIVENSKNQSYCWGEGPDMCQNLSGQNCDSSCDLRGVRCFGPTDQHCCRDECAGGCTGLRPSDCLACRKLENNGTCVNNCPQRVLHKQKPYKHNVPNPDFRYTRSRDNQCVADCGELKAQDDFCETQCKDNHVVDEAGKICIPCNGTCPIRKECFSRGEDLSSTIIDEFINCTHLTGSLKIMKRTFTGRKKSGVLVGNITIDQLKVLESLQEISDFLLVNDVNVAGLDSLSFLKNLRVIKGGELENTASKRGAIVIMHTNLSYLGLSALTEISNGNIDIRENANLCYPHNESSAFLRELFRKERQTTGIQTYLVKDNADLAVCASRNLTCSSLCTPDGCWGPGDDKCWSCKGYRFEGGCLESCESTLSVALYNLTDDKGDRTCNRCHSECADGCHGDGPDKCHRCRNVEYVSQNLENRNVSVSECRAECPYDMYSDKNSTCQVCYESCEAVGCTGPGSYPGYGGCNRCTYARATDNGTVMCLPEKTMLEKMACEDGYYESPESFNFTFINVTTAKLVRVCRRCDPECRTCKGSASHCAENACVNFREDQKCVAVCSSNYYKDEQNKTCKLCDENMIHHEVCKDSKGAILAHEAEEKRKNLEYLHRRNIAISSVVVIVVVVGAVALAVFLGRRIYQRNKRLLIITEEIQVVNTDASPDLASVRLINESELKRGSCIGSGAFGTVYKGIWFPPKENLKIPVAIKVLTEEANTNQNKELLDEARIMASVRHPYCIRMMAICMTAPMQLITPLMPCGSLLEYIRKQRTNIGSKSLLTWSVQIAKGMEYLEKRGIVHRDLAARNVLVHSPNSVRITDFGLAKMLDYKEEEFHSEGGKMPIKWLALECIEHRIYTHKSDVWSYGVTLWEIFTYGDKPYADIPPRQMPAALERGDRLSQPEICTIDVYMMMIKCWTLDAMSRPSFTELAFEFTRMASDPGRYLVIQGDEFMRLQSIVPSSSDIIRGISGMDETSDGPETCMSADDYLSPVDIGLGDGMCRPFDNLLSIPEEGSGYLNSSCGADSCDDSTTVEFCRGAGRESQHRAERRDSTPRYISDPSSADRTGENSPVSPSVLYTPKKEPRTDEGGYLKPGSLSVADGDSNYLEEGKHDAESQLSMIKKEHPGVRHTEAAVGNPGYFHMSNNDRKSREANMTAEAYCNFPLASQTASQMTKTEYCNT